MSTPTSQTFGKARSPHRQGSFRVEIVRVVGIWPRRVYIQWQLRKPTAASGYIFDVYRSGNSEGEWSLIGAALEDEYHFLDNSFPAPASYTEADLQAFRRVIYYKVVVSHGTDGSSEVIQNIEGGLDRRRKAMLQKLRRDAGVSLRKGQGTEFAVLKRRWWGDTCSCRAKAGVSTRAHCDNCHGTGVVYGYWPPVYGFAKRGAAPVNVRTAAAGKTETHVISVIMLDVPQVHVDDVLVFLRDDRRYIIKSVNPTELQAVPVHQELIVSELSRSVVEYDILVDNQHDPPWF